MWRHLRKLLGSLTIAVPLLVTLAAVLAWGTMYETRFGTAAVQRFIYQSWWFQGLLAFLALNLAVAAFERLPWRRKHVPFLLAHLGIISMLIGGIIGGRYGIEGQLIIQEGQSERVLRQSRNLLELRQLNPGIGHVIPTSFETQAWIHEPNLTMSVPIEDRTIELTVDRYYPNAEVEERIVGEGEEANPAVHLEISHAGQRGDVWLFARDPERFGAHWAEGHLMFVEPETDAIATRLLEVMPSDLGDRGVVIVSLTDLGVRREIPVPEDFSKPVAIAGTPYWIHFKDVFTDFAMTEEGIVNRSEEPNNPAVALTLYGPEGVDAHLVFALHPDFPQLHERRHQIRADITYAHHGHPLVMPNTIGLVLEPSGDLSWLFTGEAGERRIEPFELNTAATHPWLGYEIRADRYLPRALIEEEFTNRSNEVRFEALHVVAREGEAQAETWLGLGGAPTELALGDDPILIQYRQAHWELPVSVKLLDFRKIEYPGISMAEGFESDVEVTDAERGLILFRTISMNEPLRYRGFSFFQSSFFPGPVETTVLAVRKDPGTPFVYAGFLIIVAGIVSMFALRKWIPKLQQRSPR